MEKKFEKILNRLLSKQDKVLLAISGGADSICMAELYFNSKFKENIAIAHCNFNLRGEDSQKDELFVKSWAENKGVKFHIKRFDTESYAKIHKISIEMAARDLRYEYFDELCQTEGYNVLSVAHNANDNAETLILNLLRGTGSNGLSAIREDSLIPLLKSQIRMIRPLLSFSREQIELYLKTKKLNHQEDKTNRENLYNRNKIRNEVFPIFEQLNPSFVRSLNLDIERFRVENDILNDYFEERKSEFEKKCSDNELLRLDIKKLRDCKYSEYFLYRFLEKYAFNYASIQQINTLIKDKSTISGKLFSSSEYSIFTTTEDLIVSEQLSTEELFLEIKQEGIYNIGSKSLNIKVLDIDKDFCLKQKRGTIVFDKHALDFPFVIRTWKEGDWLCPLGLKNSSNKKGRKKVSDLFVDLKYSYQDKLEALILASRTSDEGHIYALLGERIDDKIKVSSATKQIIRIEIL